MIEFDISPETNQQLQKAVTAEKNQENKKKVEKIATLDLSSFKDDTFGPFRTNVSNDHSTISSETSTIVQNINDANSKIIENLPKNGEDAIGDYPLSDKEKQLTYIVNDQKKEILSSYSDKSEEINSDLQQTVKANTETKLENYKQDKKATAFSTDIETTRKLIEQGNTLTRKGAQYSAPTADEIADTLATMQTKADDNKEGKEYKDNSGYYFDYLSLKDKVDDVKKETNIDKKYHQAYSSTFTNIKDTIKSNAISDSKKWSESPIYNQTFFSDLTTYSDGERTQAKIDTTKFDPTDDNKKKVYTTDPNSTTAVNQGFGNNRYPNTNGLENYWDNMLDNLATSGLSYLNNLAGQGMGVVNDLMAAQDDPATNDPLRDYYNKAIGILNDKYSIDAMDNAFDVYIFYQAYDDKGQLNPLQNLIKPMLRLGKSDTYSNFFKNLTTPTVFGVRVLSIDIPQPKLGTTTYSWLSRDITVPGKPSMTLNSSFSFRLDQNMFYANIFEQFAGLNNMIMKNPSAANGVLDGSNSTQYKEENINTIPRSNMWSSNMKAPHLCIFVKTRNLATDWASLQKVQGPYKDLDNATDASVRAMLGSRNLVDVNDVCPALKDTAMPGFLFEDVNILGSSDISLDASGGDSAVEMTVNFTFRRCYKTKYSVMNSKKFNY